MKTAISRMITAAALIAIGFAAGRYASPQSAAQAQTDKTLATSLVRAENAVPTRGDWGEWRRYFRGDTYGTRDMVVLAVTLKPGQEPHPPHRHGEEEIMILAEGTGVWHVDGKELPARKGDVVYAGPWGMHGVKNTGAGPLTYYMVKWNNKGVPAPKKPDDGAKKEADKKALDGAWIAEDRHLSTHWCNRQPE